jgi:hypothetical protein
VLREYGFGGGKDIDARISSFPDVFPFGVDARRAEELLCWNRAFPRGADDAKRRLQGDRAGAVSDGCTMKLGPPPKMA